MIEHRGRSDSFEDALASVEADADRAVTAAAATVRQLKKVKAAAKTGNVRELEKALVAARGQDQAARDHMDRLATSWRFDERQHLESGAFVRELRDLASARDLSIVEQDGRLLTYPSVIRVLPAEAALEIDRKRERKIRPSFLIERLRAGQSKAPRFRPEPFLETLRKAYDLLLANGGKRHGGTVRLVDVHGLLTMLPGLARDYARQEFARDVYLLDRSGVRETRDGSTLRLPASTGTKGSGTLSTVTPDGELKVYYGIAFDHDHPTR